MTRRPARGLRSDASDARPSARVVSDAWIGAVDRPLEPLWRGLLVYRGLTLVSAIAVALYRLGEYAHPVGVVVVLGAMTAWTAATAYLYLVRPAPAGRGGGRPRR